MTDTHNTSDEMLADIDEKDIDREQQMTTISIHTRRRLEEKIAERKLAKEMREFDFDC
jgi:hypothetical protein